VGDLAEGFGPFRECFLWRKEKHANRKRKSRRKKDAKAARAEAARVEAARAEAARAAAARAKAARVEAARAGIARAEAARVDSGMAEREAPPPNNPTNNNRRPVHPILGSHRRAETPPGAVNPLGANAAETATVTAASLEGERRPSETARMRVGNEGASLALQYEAMSDNRRRQGSGWRFFRFRNKAQTHVDVEQNADDAARTSGEAIVRRDTLGKVG